MYFATGGGGSSIYFYCYQGLVMRKVFFLQYLSATGEAPLKRVIQLMTKGIGKGKPRPWGMSWGTHLVVKTQK